MSEIIKKKKKFIKYTTKFVVFLTSLFLISQIEKLKRKFYREKYQNKKERYITRERKRKKKKRIKQKYTFQNVNEKINCNS